MSSSLRASREIPSPDPCNNASTLELPLHSEPNPTRTPSIYTYSPCSPSSTYRTPATLSPCLKSAASSPLLAHAQTSPSRNRNISPRFSDTPEYIPSYYAPPPSTRTRAKGTGSSQVKYPGLAARGSAPPALPSQTLAESNAEAPADEGEMPDLITFSPPVGTGDDAPASLPTRFTSTPPPCYAPRPGGLCSPKASGVLRRPSFKINLPRCPDPSELAAQVGRATGTGPAPRTFSRTPYPDEEGVDYLSRALDRVEVKCSRSSSSTGEGRDGTASPPRIDTPGTLSPGSGSAGSSEAGRSSMESSHGRSLPVVEVAIREEDGPPVGIKFSDPWEVSRKPVSGVGRGRHMHRGRGMAGRRGMRHPADASDDEGSDADEESGPEDDHEAERLLRQQLGSPCLSPHSSTHRSEESSGFPGMLAKVGRRISGQGGLPGVVQEEEER